MEQMGINPMERAKMDSEYTALMAELGVGYGSGTSTVPPGVRKYHFYVYLECFFTYLISSTKL